ncbi:MAG: H-type lectin domain-containing protein [Pseudomonadota bacterium]
MDGTRPLGTQFAQQTTSPLVGMQIITATGEIFNHVDNNDPMWSGEGDREVRFPVTFAAPFQKPPHITVGLSGIDSSRAQNLRFNLSAEEITRDGFVLSFVTWDDTKIARACATWSAIGSAVPVSALRRGG